MTRVLVLAGAAAVVRSIAREREQATIDDRLNRLWETIDAAPKTSKWRWRAKVGERVRWYEEPEEEAETD